MLLKRCIAPFFSHFPPCPFSWSAPISWVTVALRTSRFLPCEVRGIGSGCKHRGWSPLFPHLFGGSLPQIADCVYNLGIPPISLGIACILRALMPLYGLQVKRLYGDAKVDVKKSAHTGNKESVKRLPTQSSRYKKQNNLTNTPTKHRNHTTTKTKETADLPTATKTTTSW